MNIKEKIKNQLIKESDFAYKTFTASLIPTIDNVLGVRLPKLRKIAKNLASSEDCNDFLALNNFDFHEETMLQGMVIGYLKRPLNELLPIVESFVPKINNWAICDSFCCGLKFSNDNKAEVWDFLQKYFHSEKEFDLRFGFVMLLNYFLTDSYIDKVFDVIDEFTDEKYYSKMAVAWLVSVAYTKYPQKTINYLKKSKLSSPTFNKSVQKICESNKVSKEEKAMIKSLKNAYSLNKSKPF